MPPRFHGLARAVLLVPLLAFAACAPLPQEGPAPAEVPSNVPIWAADGALATQIRDRLQADPLLQGTEIIVEVHRGRVVLAGSVRNDEQREKALVLAREVPGVRQVDDAILVAGPEGSPKRP